MSFTLIKIFKRFYFLRIHQKTFFSSFLSKTLDNSVILCDNI
ncbi:hypothetical protein QN326_05890 [Candidatus Phytoplasma asteris]|uniref:Uncharacterized protein n=1 Tax=Candidatus Phytoplasma asteris TaxID=85620 RepID=A0ABZ3CGN3_9MOLU